MTNISLVERNLNEYKMTVVLWIHSEIVDSSDSSWLYTLAR